jgi:RNA polymerase sigma-70 factor (ECF subfamily)
MADSRGPAESDAVDHFLSSGTEQAFSELFAIVYPQVLRYFSFRGFANELAEEMAQDVMVAVYRKAATLRERGLFRAWLFKVARNTMRQHLRRARNDLNLLPLEEVAAREREASGTILEHAGFLDMISVLGIGERHVMSLRYIDGLSYEEIATVLEIPLGTVKWKIFDSKSRICSHLRQPVPEHA